MCLHGVIGDIFSGVEQLPANGDESANVLSDHFVWR